MVSKQQMKKTRGGFTLIELLISLAVGAILMTVAIPGFYNMVKSNRMTTSLNEFVTTLNLARSEAIKQNTRVAVCKSNDGKSCTTSGGWEQGWIAFVDKNNNASVDPSNNEAILNIHGALERGVNQSNKKIQFRGNQQVTDYISYPADGFPRMITGALQPGTITICDDRGKKYGKAVVINATGRLDTRKVEDTPQQVCY